MNGREGTFDGYVRTDRTRLHPADAVLVLVTRVIELRRVPTRPIDRIGSPEDRLVLEPAPPVVTGRLTPKRKSQLRPVRSGASYRIVSAPKRGLAVSHLAEALEDVFERFASARGFSPDRPLDIGLMRGYWPASPGHREGRAVDIGAVGGHSLLAWKRDSDRSASGAAEAGGSADRERPLEATKKANLGFALYKALQEHGGWRQDETSWRPYRGVVQLFGPWTATEGPWTRIRAAARTARERQRLADQAWVFDAHRDHIHVGR